ncbi:MAG: DNA mismatch repair endonuclease MutL [Geobacter sp.]|nr:DNA mismatch repair endonuclease MutL [Geobacter sp.]
MTQRIRILPENLTNKIAAGEVVERPASVVKELLENALDAGATDIVVEIEGGGKRLIRITDNGCGMSRDDALLALERHATSKILTESDLEGIATLGFRGEALPSIASVSRFTMASRETDNIEGSEIYAEGGKIREVKACGMASGTIVTIRNLFFNTPARLKFLKSPETEAGHVGDLVTRIALSRPDVRFTYLSDGKTVIKVSPGGLASRVSDLLGKGIGNSVYPVEYDDDYLRVDGLVSSPDCCRSAPSHVYTFINGRFVRDKVVQHAVMAAYRPVLEQGRYPVVILFVGIDAGEVDVNVHPTKHEIRFRQQGRAHDAICAAVESILRRTPWIREPLPAAASPALPRPSASEQRVAEVRDLLVSYGSMPPARSGDFRNRGAASENGAARPEPAAIAPLRAGIDLNEPAEGGGYFSSLTVIGQFQAQYILCQDREALVIIDQHAAHERVAFERLKREFSAGGVAVQKLLFPETLEFTFAEEAALRESLEEICRLGFDLESFGGRTWLLKGSPQLLAGHDHVSTLRDMVCELQEMGKSRKLAEAVDELLSTIACHSVVRGVHALTVPEIRALLLQMDATNFAGSCPHGRPVFRKITLSEIERMFKRT